MKSRTSTGNVMESAQPVQMGGGVNPNCWSIRPPPASTITRYQQLQQHPPPYTLLLQTPNNNSFLPFNPPSSITLSPYSPQPTSSSNSSSWHEHDSHQQQQQPQDHQQHLPSETWSQLLLGGMDQDEEEKQPANKLKFPNWEQSQVMLQQQHLHDLNYDATSLVNIKQEHHSVPSGCYNMFGHGDEDYLATKTSAAWSSIVLPNSSPPPKSCVTSLSNNNNNNMLDFSSNKGDGIRHPTPDHHIESNSSRATGGVSKKARVQQSPPSQLSNTFKVRKEKLGDRITALHQLVSPFGKTDTASVLLEAMGYIRFLQSQIEALSLPYLGSGSRSTSQQQQQHHMRGQGERNCIFPEDPGQLLNENCTERKASAGLQEPGGKGPNNKDLRSRGLCLVPVSCTLQVGSDNGADYWAPPAPFGGGFR
uniref:BHLH domain-containing protein n=1 Tax=Kalanchoe fedtschenkoi TaxID=63787 RepID=A0A7N0U258_KALFE